MKRFDYIIVGSGIAGLYCALLAREHGSVLIITKGSLEECNTRYAQGGIAAPIGPGDSPDLHLKDTLAAGAGLTDPEVARILTEEAADRISDLINFGVPFDTVHGEITLAREAAHSLPRILHAGGDATGKHIELTLSSLARLSNITILEYSMLSKIAVEKGRVQGAVVLDASTGAIEEMPCDSLIIATGGAGRLFKFTTNSEVVTGDGVALAYRAGAEIMDMEFFQFHPTALRMPGVTPFLISEAVRGEGGILRNAKGRAFMKDYDPQAELAPRDVVARAIVAEMKKDNSDHVYLDVTHLPSQTVLARFPQIYRFCREHGLDITRASIPVAPAAHYMMGGVKTTPWGETNVKGLFAVGEVACTGVHGANRLASNSLMETLIFGKRLIERTQAKTATEWIGDRVEEMYRLPQRKVKAAGYPRPSMSTLQSLMWEKVGIIRSGQGLKEATSTLAAWQTEVNGATDRPSLELTSAILVGRLMAEAALIRTESRGAHYRVDYPEPSPEWQKHIVFKQE